MPLSDGPALLAAVLAAPEDEAPRLILADWLDEHGDADRAAFIRVQVELAGRTAEVCRLVAAPTARGGCGRCAACQAAVARDVLVGRQAALWERFGSRWRVEASACLRPHEEGPPARSLADGGLWRHLGANTFPEFRRGFPEVVEMTGDEFVFQAGRLRAAHPIREARLTTLPSTEHGGMGSDLFWLTALPRSGAEGVSWREFPPGTDATTRTRLLLCRNFPGIVFHLPPSRDDFEDRGAWREWLDGRAGRAGW